VSKIELTEKNARRASPVQLIDFLLRNLRTPNQNWYRPRVWVRTHPRNEIEAIKNRQSERDDHDMRKLGLRDCAQNLQSYESCFDVLNPDLYHSLPERPKEITNA
jgi:hypothetical protein